MKKSIWITALFTGLITFLTSCGTQQKVAPTPEATPVSAPVVTNVAPQKDIISVAEAIEIFLNPSSAPTIAKRYGYKLKNNYEVYRLDKFTKMYYKNCTLAKLLTATAYSDYPKPQAKGVSSYIAFKDGAIIIAVFNQTAYNNLVEQVKANGFVLDMPGNEDYYKKGNLTIACSAANKSIRIQ